MRIAINTTSANYGGGMTYLKNLIRHLTGIDNNNDYIILTTVQNKEIWGVEGKNIFIKSLKLPSVSLYLRLFWEQFILPFYLKREKIDLLFSPANIMPIFSPCKNVVTIQHVSNFQFPDSLPFLKRKAISFLMRISCHRANAIIAISRYTKEDLTKHIDIPKEKIRIIYHGVDSFFKPIKKEVAKKKVDELLGVKVSYVLSIASGFHRNIIGAIKAFNIAANNCKKPLKFINLGLKGSDWEETMAEIKKLGLENDVILAKYIPHEQMNLLYSDAEILLSPTFGDSFSLPLVEAMACGCPIVTSNDTACPEIVDDAGIKVNPYNVDEIANAMHQVITNLELRNELIKKGLERAKEFSWEKTSRETLRVFEKVYESD